MTSSDRATCFLAALRAEPDNDEPRLLFADWLQERGDRRGELMALQCALERLDEDDPRRQQMHRQAEDVFQELKATLWQDGPAGIPLYFSDLQRGLFALSLFGDRLRDPALGLNWFLAHQSWVTDLSLWRVTDDAIRDFVARGLLSQVISLEIRMSSGSLREEITDAGLAAIGTLTQLQKLSLKGNDVSDAGLEHLAPLSGLRELSINGSRVTGTGLKHLPSLTKLSLCQVPVSDDGMQQLGLLTGLRELHLADVEVIDQDLEPIALWAQLESLDLARTEVADEGLKHLAELRRLRKLCLAQTLVTDEGLRHLARLTQLEELSLFDCPVADAGMRHLAGLTRLRTLDLASTRVTDAGLACLADLVALRKLSLFETEVTGAGLVSLAEMRQLRELSLYSTRVTDAGLMHLASLEKLHTLRLDHTPVTDAGMAYLARLPRLETLSLRCTRVTEEGLRQLGALQNGSALAFTGAVNRVVNEQLGKFGLVPREEDLPRIRALLTEIIDADPGSYPVAQCESVALFYCVQLFSRGCPEDALLIWRLRCTSMDMASVIDIELLCGAGLEATIQFLASHPDEEATQALAQLAYLEEIGSFADFSPAERLDHYRRYFGIA